MSKESLVYSLVRTLTYPVRWMPYTAIHRLGRLLGYIAFYCMRDYRKRALSNIALAKDLCCTPRETIRIAKQSFQNLAINCLEYPKFDVDKYLDQTIRCENPETAAALYAKKQGIIFFCGHQSNWEALFLDGTHRMEGVAIGKAIKNKKLYRWIISIREKNGGKLVAPRNAIFEGFRALKRGAFIGIVGDQGMPNSGYAFPFLGRRAWTSTAPALLAYRTNSPILYAHTRRVSGGYRIRYSEPLWPDLSKPMEKEVIRLMNHLLTQLQESIKQYPGEWLWQHNRWKQQTPQNVYKRFRHDCIAIILPSEPDAFRALLPHLSTFRQIYPLDFLSLLVPEQYRHEPLIDAEKIYYRNLRETLLPDFRFKLVFNFTNYRPIRAHYERLSAFEVLDLPTLEKLAEPHRPSDLSDVLKRALCRPGTLWMPSKSS
ncbi:MAG: hypothetical protein KGJ02_01095 [Verrucomicrobiota bacterium]|nr:hypothetical protein [Verrucomicrobiota bacterium]